MPAMTKVAFTDTTGPDATKLYADRRWRGNPRISPSSWRASQGMTVGKVAFDARRGLDGLAEAVKAGCNLLVAAPETLRALEAAIIKSRMPREALVVVCVGHPDALVEGPDAWVWPLAQDGADDHLAQLTRLERAVKERTLAFYGVAGADGAFDLAAWLDLAGQAALAVWERRKRSALRLVMVPLNMVELSALHQAATRHKDEAVSVLELAARLDLMVVADRALAWRGGWGEVDMGVVRAEKPDPLLASALAALTRLGEVERQVMEALNGWPTREGVPLFGVLPALAAGQSPWPSAEAWRRWRKLVWPELDMTWQGFSVGLPVAREYLRLWGELMPHGEALAEMAEGRLAATLRAPVAKAMPPAWRPVPWRAQVWGAVSSLPGVTAVLAEVPKAALPDLEAVLTRPDMVEVAAVFGGV